MSDPRQHLCEMTALAFGRRLLDNAGGNFSAREDDRIYCTPRYAGSKRHWQLRPDEIIVADMDGRKLEGEGELSREFKMHLGIYRAFPEANGICHAHAQNVMVFANLHRRIPPTSEQTRKYGVIELAEEQPAHSEELARTVVETLGRRRDRLAKNAIACLLPYHGITVVGRDLDDAYDALERIDGSCYILIARAALLAADAAGR